MVLYYQSMAQCQLQSHILQGNFLHWFGEGPSPRKPTTLLEDDNPGISRGTSI